MGRAELVLDPAWTQPMSIGWWMEGLKTNRRRQSVESISSLSGAWVGLVSAKVRQKLQIVVRIYKFCQNLQNFPGIYKFLTKIYKF